MMKGIALLPIRSVPGSGVEVVHIEVIAKDVSDCRFGHSARSDVLADVVLHERIRSTPQKIDAVCFRRWLRPVHVRILNSDVRIARRFNVLSGSSSYSNIIYKRYILDPAIGDPHEFEHCLNIAELLSVNLQAFNTCTGRRNMTRKSRVGLLCRSPVGRVEGGCERNRRARDGRNGHDPYFGAGYSAGIPGVRDPLLRTRSRYPTCPADEPVAVVR